MPSGSGTSCQPGDLSSSRARTSVKKFFSSSRENVILSLDRSRDGKMLVSGFCEISVSAVGNFSRLWVKVERCFPPESILGDFYQTKVDDSETIRISGDFLNAER